jgi:hypothetical protein
VVTIETFSSCKSGCKWDFLQLQESQTLKQANKNYSQILARCSIYYVTEEDQTMEYCSNARREYMMANFEICFTSLTWQCHVISMLGWAVHITLKRKFLTSRILKLYSRVRSTGELCSDFISVFVKINLFLFSLCKISFHFPFLFHFPFSRISWKLSAPLSVIVKCTWRLKYVQKLQQYPTPNSSLKQHKRNF